MRRSAPGGETVEHDSRFDRRLTEILACATDVFYEKGYAAASVRDLSRATGMSLAGLYHYFDSKEKLLYLIQKQTFSTILERLRERLEGVTDPEQRVRIFIHNHLEYFLANKKAMKVFSHEADVLTGEAGSQVRAIKREYYRACIALVEDLGRAKGLEWGPAEVRIAVLSLFGMVNWIYTWHNPRTDADAGALSTQMADMFLQGILKRKKRTHKTTQS
ncbi:MAG: TetR/AcrR family transcriptional regulator [Acidobacteriales bacterium]|nr:TetR/AcrR family transcriptional regulator [Terriglobales bacterium]